MDPVLAEKIYTEGGTRYRLRVRGCLRYLRANSAPYFSITGDQDRYERGYWRDDCGGCCHELIEAQFPGRFTDLIAMHLSDMDGAPLHNAGNAFYFFAGACGGLGERYHYGNGKAQHWKGEPDAVGSREFDGYREPMPDECLRVFADYVRIPLANAEALRAACLKPAERETPRGIYHVPAIVRAELARQVDAMRPRWAEEAAACIARHGLKVYGDAWTPKAEG